MSKIKFLMVTALMILTVALTGCGSSDNSGNKNVAICFPNTTPSWQRNSSALQEQLSADGFNVEVQSSSTIEEQQKQIKDLLQHKPNCMVIGAIDSAALVEVLEDAKTYEVPIIAFDRIILNTDAVSYYASFDNDAIGEAQGLKRRSIFATAADLTTLNFLRAELPTTTRTFSSTKLWKFLNLTLRAGNSSAVRVKQILTASR